jgi:hypothetical protein
MGRQDASLGDKMEESMYSSVSHSNYRVAFSVSLDWRQEFQVKLVLQKSLPGRFSVSTKAGT